MKQIEEFVETEHFFSIINNITKFWFLVSFISGAIVFIRLL